MTWGGVIGGVLLAALLVLVAAKPAEAHDFWLEPSDFCPEEGMEVDVSLLLGEHLRQEEERPIATDLTEKFEAYSSTGVRDILTGSSLRADHSGGLLLGLSRAVRHLTLPGDRFTAYLQEEGLQSILAARESAGETASPGRERYRRCLKALLQVGDISDSIFSRILGQTLEIIPLADPYRLKPGESLRVQVLFEGNPLPEAQITAYCRSRKDTVSTQTATTDAAGEAAFVLDHARVWLIRLVHMHRCPDPTDADWESFWAALTFGFPARRSDG